MKLLKNYIYQFIYQFINLLVPIVTLPYITKVLGPENLGEYTYSFSIISYLILFSDLGIKMYGSRKIAYLSDSIEEQSKVFVELFLQKFVFTIIILIGTIIYFNINKYPSLYYIQSLNLIAFVLDISWFFQGIEEFKKITIRNIISKIILIIGLFLFIKNQTDLIRYTYLIVIINFFSNLAFWVSINKYVKIQKIKNIKIFRYIKESFEMFLPQVAISIYALLDRVMLGYLSKKEYVTYYDVSNKLVIISMILVTTAGGIFLPRISNLYFKNQIKEIKKLINKTSAIFNLIAFPLMFGIIAISDNLVDILFTSSYDNMKVLLKVMALTIIFWSWNNITGSQILLPTGRERKLTISVTIGAVLNIFLNYFLIKRYNALGATIATVFTEGIVTGIQIYYSRDYFIFPVKTILKALLSSIVMFLVIIQLKNLFLQILLGIIIYIILLFLLKEKNVFEILQFLKDKWKDCQRKRVEK